MQGKAEAKPKTRPGASAAETPETVEKKTVRELFDFVLNEGRKEYTSSATKVWAK